MSPKTQAATPRVFSSASAASKAAAYSGPVVRMSRTGTPTDRSISASTSAGIPWNQERPRSTL